jgi:molecular chaperone DnaJ
MSNRDLYDVLGVSRDADEATLKKAYRKLAMELHPDRNPGDKNSEARFKEINSAYAALKDPDKRAAYDRFGHAAFEGGGPAGANAQGFDFGSGFADIFDEMFGEFVGGGQRGNEGASHGNDLRYNMEISLEDAFKGRKTTIRVPTSVACESCSGSGAKSGTKPVNCGTCHGRGRVRATQGFFTIERTCPGCHGAGKMIQDPCGDCGGTGRTHKERTLSVTIPPGVDDGTRIRLPGEGEAGMRGAPAGDLYIFISVTPHRFFQRDGANIYCRVPISMTTAALGGTVEVPTVEGTRARVNVPSGTQAGAQFRLKSKGMSVLRSKSRGDMYIEVAVETPRNLTKKQQELLREFDATGGSRTNPESEGFFSKVKELWEDLKD